MATLAWLILCLPVSCRQPTPQETNTDGAAAHSVKKNTELLVGSWVEPNPINANEFQGMKIRADGSAESINMATLLYKKWWMEDDSLVLVSESIGNRVTSLDTMKYAIIRLDTEVLEIRFNDYHVVYQRQI